MQGKTDLVYRSTEPNAPKPPPRSYPTALSLPVSIPIVLEKSNASDRLATISSNSFFKAAERTWERDQPRGWLRDANPEVRIARM